VDNEVGDADEGIRVSGDPVIGFTVVGEAVGGVRVAGDTLRGESVVGTESTGKTVGILVEGDAVCGFAVVGAQIGLDDGDVEDGQHVNGDNESGD